MEIAKLKIQEELGNCIILDYLSQEYSITVLLQIKENKLMVILKKLKVLSIS